MVYLVPNEGADSTTQRAPAETGTEFVSRNLPTTTHFYALTVISYRVLSVLCRSAVFQPQSSYYLFFRYIIAMQSISRLQ